MGARRQKELCAENRRALLRYPDESVRPKARDDNSCIIEEGNHEEAYLQHDVHAEPTVRFFRAV